VLVALDGECGTLYGEGFEAEVEPVEAELEPSLQLLSAAEVRSYKQMKEGTSGNTDETADTYWLNKTIARLADTEAKGCIDDMNVVLKGGSPNSAVRAQIKAICSEARACFKDKVAAATSTMA
jgi:hypothetical protein